jgi:type IV pilus assembly protein PilC
MNFTYKAIDANGKGQEGQVSAVNRDLAIAALQRRGLIVTSLSSEEKKSFLQMSFFDRVPLKDVVVFSRQISTLFESQVSALKAFSMLASNTENRLLQKTLQGVADDLQAGASISGALGKHPNVFSEFYVNMVRAGEESGKLNNTFSYLADYLDRQYELTSKTRNALIYPAFIIATFFIVMILMFTMVIPKLSVLIIESGQTIPIYTKIILAISDFLVGGGGVMLLIVFVLLGLYLGYYSRSESGKKSLDAMKLNTPIIGPLVQKLYLSRMADNIDTMLSSGISIVRSLEITSQVVGSPTYKEILEKAQQDVQSGSALSAALIAREEIPGIMIQMIEVGEETGSLGSILKTLAAFYKREVDDAVDTLVGLIEPAMIILLAVGVGVLLASVLVPIYNIAGSIS